MIRPRGAARRSDRWIAGRWSTAWVLWYWHKWRGITFPLWVRPGRRRWLSLTGFTTEEKHSVKRPDVKSGDEPGGGPDLPASKLLLKCDRLSDLLCSATWDDGATKGQRCLFLFIQGQTVRVLAKVERPPLKVSSIGRSIDEALVALDALLGSPDVPWETDNTQNGGPSKKKR